MVYDHDVAGVCQLRQLLNDSLLVGITDADITGSNWSAMIKCHLEAQYSFLSDEAQYTEVLNRTNWLHMSWSVPNAPNFQEPKFSGTQN